MSPVLPNGGFTAAITCQATLTTRTLSCDEATLAASGGIEASVILGGQGTYVELTSSGTAYDALTQAFTTNVTVQNRTAQPMATADGTTPDVGGIKVFVHSGPTTTNGTGTVAVANADGTGTFTGSNQPYWQYDGVLPSGSSSGPKLWKFAISGTVNTFTFQVFVSTQLPADASVLRWLSVTSPTTQTLRAVNMNRNPTTGFAVGDNGTILYYDGTSWSAVNTGLSLSGINLYGVAYRGSGVVYVVGDRGTIVHSPDNGLTWGLQTSGVTTTLLAVGEGPGVNGAKGPAMFAAGVGGVILYAADGATWSPQSSGTTDSLFMIDPTGSTSEVAFGQAGTLLVWDGTNWSPQNTGTSASMHDGAAVGSDSWLFGSGGTILHSTMGTSWAPQASGTSHDLYGGLHTSNVTNVIAVGSGGTILVWNGISWSAMTSGTTASLTSIGVSPENPAVDYWAVGTGGIILHGTR